MYIMKWNKVHEDHKYSKYYHKSVFLMIKGQAINDILSTYQVTKSSDPNDKDTPDHLESKFQKYSTCFQISNM